MLALHSPVEGFVAFTVQEPASLILNQHSRCYCHLRWFIDVHTIKTPGGLAMFITCVKVLIKTAIICRKGLITQA